MFYIQLCMLLTNKSQSNATIMYCKNLNSIFKFKNINCNEIYRTFWASEKELKNKT
jgi:hypothetical protein